MSQKISSSECLSMNADNKSSEIYPNPKTRTTTNKKSIITKKLKKMVKKIRETDTYNEA